MNYGFTLVMLLRQLLGSWHLSLCFHMSCHTVPSSRERLNEEVVVGQTRRDKEKSIVTPA